MSDAERPGDPNDEGRPVEPRPASGADVPAPDPRPRPQYGEYAPEGWTWTPPEPPAAAAPPNPPAAPAAPAAAAFGRATGSGPGTARRPPDFAVTIAMLVLGVLGVVFAIGVTQAYPQSIALFHEQEGLPGYEPGPEVPLVTGIGSAVQFALFAATLIGAWLRIRVRRSSWWVPVIGFALSIVVLFIVGFVLIAGDTMLIEHFEQLATT